MPAFPHPKKIKGELNEESRLALSMGVMDRLARPDPAGALAWAESQGSPEAFLEASAQRPPESDPLAPSAWGGGAKQWERAGARCAQLLLESGSPQEGMALMLKASRPELFKGAQALIGEAAWLELAVSRMKDPKSLGLGEQTARSFQKALLLFGPSFQNALMELDWEGPRRLQRDLGDRKGGSPRLCGLNAMAGFSAAGPLSRALDFLSARGLDPAEQLWGMGSAPLSYAVVNMSGPCARLIAEFSPQSSIVAAVSPTLELWSSAWESFFGEESAQRLIQSRLAFAEGLDLESALGRGAPGGQRPAL